MDGQPHPPQDTGLDPASERVKRHHKAIEALNDTSLIQRKAYGHLTLFELSILSTTRFFSLPNAHRLTRQQFRLLCADLWHLQLFRPPASLSMGKLPVMPRTKNHRRSPAPQSLQRADTLMSLYSQLDNLDFKRTNVCISAGGRVYISLFSFVKRRYIYHPRKCQIHSSYSDETKFACRQYLCVQGRDASIDAKILQLAEKYFQGNYVYWTL